MNKTYYIYDIREALRQYSDDSDITNAHISFLIDDTRALLLRQKYKAVGSIIPNSIKQRLHLDLELADDNEFISLDSILRTENALPKLIESADYYRNIQIDGGSYTDVKFIFTTNERFPYVGTSKWLNNIIYTTLGQDYRLYFRAGNPRHKGLLKVRVFAPFEDPKTAWESSADYDSTKSFDDDINYPIDLDMWIQMKEIILKQYVQSLQIPEDKVNNAAEE